LDTELLKEFFDRAEHQKRGNVLTKKMEFEIHLDEKNVLPSGCSKDDYGSKDLLPSARIQGFPIRGRTVYLIIRRRWWRHTTT
jgi:hypothetical protein